MNSKPNERQNEFGTIRKQPKEANASDFIRQFAGVLKNTKDLHVAFDLFPRTPLKIVTSRDRAKLAPYLRLQNSKRTSKCQFTVLENRKSKKMDRVARRSPLVRAPGALKGGHFRN